MALNQGRCVHCLEYKSELTWDHVPPESWYPNNTPNDLEKWKVPSCDKCNKLYGKIEEELLLKFGLCIDPRNPRSAGIPYKALRALKAEYGKNEKDVNARRMKKEKILKEAKYGDDIPKKGIYPGFEFKGNKNDEKIGVLIRKNHLEKIAEKIVRGIAYIVDGKYIEKPYHIDFFAHNPTVLKDFLANVHPGPWDVFERPPGFAVLRALAVEDMVSGIYLIDIWGQFYCSAFVNDR
jgi:hypothetical protein